MMQLKKNRPEFEMTTGPFKGRRFVHGRNYGPDEIPQNMRDHFAAVEADRPVPQAKPKGFKSKETEA